MKNPVYTAKDYLEWDYQNSFFPLEITRYVSVKYFDKILTHITEKIFDEKQAEYSFLPQKKCHAAKNGFHLRRT
jgi:hypothetical protein